MTRSALVLAAALLALLALPAAALAKGYADKPATEWSQAEIQEIITKSPWVQEVQAFPAALRAPDDAMAKPIGSIQRVPISIAWASSGIYRHARAKLFKDITPDQVEDMTRPSDRFYIITLENQDTLSVFDSVSEADLVAATSLEVGDKKLPLALVQRPADLKAPQVSFFFERPHDGIPADVKTAVFKTKARDLALEAKFKLDKMTWMGKRDLDGDIGEISVAEKRRREVQTAVLGTESPEFHRSVTDVRLEKRGDPNRPYAAYVFYDPAREPAPEGGVVDVAARKLGIAQRVGTWSAANKSVIQAIVFVNPRTGKAEDYVLGTDAEKIAKMAPEGAAKAFKEKLVSADKKDGATSKKEAPAKGGKNKGK